MLWLSLFRAVWLNSRLETIRKRAARAACLIKMPIQSRDCHVVLCIIDGIRLCFQIRLYYFSNMNPFLLLALSLNTVYISHFVDKRTPLSINHDCLQPSPSINLPMDEGSSNSLGSDAQHRLAPASNIRFRSKRSWFSRRRIRRF